MCHFENKSVQYLEVQKKNVISCSIELNVNPATPRHFTSGKKLKKESRVAEFPPRDRPGLGPMRKPPAWLWDLGPVGPVGPGDLLQNLGTGELVWDLGTWAGPGDLCGAWELVWDLGTSVGPGHLCETLDGVEKSPGPNPSPQVPNPGTHVSHVLPKVPASHLRSQSPSRTFALQVPNPGPTGPAGPTGPRSQPKSTGFGGETLQP